MSQNELRERLERTQRGSAFNMRDSFHMHLRVGGDRDQDSHLRDRADDGNLGADDREDLRALVSWTLFDRGRAALDAFKARSEAFGQLSGNAD